MPLVKLAGVEEKLGGQQVETGPEGQSAQVRIILYLRLQGFIFTDACDEVVRGGGEEAQGAAGEGGAPGTGGSCKNNSVSVTCSMHHLGLNG